MESINKYFQKIGIIWNNWPESIMIFRNYFSNREKLIQINYEGNTELVKVQC